jgi:hypothetical protein
MCDTDPLNVRIAIEIERKSIGSAEYWTEEELRAWCFSDPFGKKSFRGSLVIADHLIDKFDMKEREYDSIYAGTA